MDAVAHERARSKWVRPTGVPKVTKALFRQAAQSAALKQQPDEAPSVWPAPSFAIACGRGQRGDAM
jgi:hypothetical protein